MIMHYTPYMDAHVLVSCALFQARRLPGILVSSVGIMCVQARRLPGILVSSVGIMCAHGAGVGRCVWCVCFLRTSAAF